MKDTWFGADVNVPPKHGETEMSELPVLKYKGGIGIHFVTEGRMEGMLMRPDLYGMTSIPDTMEVVIRRAGDCVEVITRLREEVARAAIAKATALYDKCDKEP